MSEFPEWVERRIGLTDISYQRAQQIHEELREGRWPDPRGTGERIWWRKWWFFDRDRPIFDRRQK